MPFRELQWLFPFLVALHNAEEVFTLPKWKRPSGLWFGGVSPTVFRFAAIILTVLAFVTTTLSARAGPMTLWANLNFGFIVAMLLNALVPHIAVSVLRRAAMPGVITAATLNLPILSLLALLALRQGYVSLQAALVFCIAVPLLLLLATPLLFRLGRLLGL